MVLFPKLVTSLLSTQTSLQGPPYETKTARGGCAPADLIANEVHTSEQSAQMRCTQLEGCKFYTWSADPANALHGAWFCRKDNYEGADGAWHFWRVGRDKVASDAAAKAKAKEQAILDAAKAKSEEAGKIAEAAAAKSKAKSQKKISQILKAKKMAFFY